MSTEYHSWRQLTYPLPPPTYQQWPTWYRILAPPLDINVLPLIKVQAKSFSRTRQVMASCPQNKFIPCHIHENLIFPSIATQKYRLPPPPSSKIDHWLTSIAHTGGYILFLKDYLLLEDVRKEYVECWVEHLIIKVHVLKHIYLNYFSFYATRPLTATLSLRTLILTFCTSQHMSLPPPRPMSC